MTEWIIARLRERSTWLGVVSAATALGLRASPEQQQAVISIGLALAGAIAAFTADRR